MKNIPVIKNRSIVDFCRDYKDTARDLLNESVGGNKMLSILAKVLILPCADFVSKKWLEKSNNPYLDEINEYSNIIKSPGVYALNLCYEWGCSSAVFNNVNGSNLLRILDWPFSGLGINIKVLEQNCKYGKFYNITWPGLSGMYQGLAPGRFAISINQAPMRLHGLGLILSWLKNRIMHWRQNTLPPSHLVRYVFENAETFESAKKMLAETPISMPVFFIISGVEENEGCVIERLENDVVIRKIDKTGQVSVSNHFQTNLDAKAIGWKSRALDSNARASAVQKIDYTKISYEDFKFLNYPLVNPLTRLTMLANAATGELIVQGWEEDGAATMVLHTVASR